MMALGYVSFLDPPRPVPAVNCAYSAPFFWVLLFAVSHNSSYRSTAMPRVLSKKRAPSKKGSISDLLKNFDDLPDAANVRQPVVQAIYNWSPATLWRRVADGTIPKPDKLSPGINTWNVGKLRAARAALDRRT
jgi:predicted DNA-binding transcriptional regulator AlpA